MRTPLFIIICLVFFSTSCKKEEIKKEEPECTEDSQSISFEKLLEANSGNFCIMKNVDNTLEKVELVIQSQADYEKYIDCLNAIPYIDFEQKTLLAGRSIVDNRDKVLKQEVYQECDNDIVFEVAIGHGVQPAVSAVYYFAIIPKIEKTASVRFNVTQL